MVDVYVASVIVFFAFLAILIYRDRKNIEIKSKILILKRTKRFRDFLDSIARISPKFWKIFSTVGILISIYIMIVGLILIGKVSYDIALGLYEQPPYQLILPTPTSQGAIGPGYILIPFWFWIITIAIILIPHEFLHGVIALSEKIRLKSVGLLLFLIFPGAFVEPDENQLKKAKLLTRLRIFAAGSFANLIVALLAILAMSYLVWPSVTLPGISVMEVNETGPAGLAGLKPNVTLTEIDGQQIKTRLCNPLVFLIGQTCRSIFYVEQFQNLKPNQTVVLKSDNVSYTIKLGYNENTGSPYMGTVYTPIHKENSEFQLSILMPLLTMIALFSFAVGMINILPIYPLDGGLMFEALVKKVFKNNYRKIVRAVTTLVILMILYGFIGPYFR